MEEWGSYHNRFVRISREMPNHTARQISEHWRNSLNPDLCHDPLSINEKIFITERVRKCQMRSTTIHWKYIINGLVIRFGKLRSENKIKNFFNSRQRRERTTERAYRSGIDHDGRP
ncbi:unnamed protein product [Rhizophagus irregularis]|uniref:HTH myb-type domain-containing protein n=1 Tax=Rhizophagus irregularis TaxID=588596 RepID=A0A916EHN9_9GLOM|nr:unnamed protein product [Rhizophagus irregularis]CAB5389122.1 unnamed protein product [Rhizophagus irregularis]